MGSRSKSKNNVIAASFPNIAKEGGNQSGQTATIVPFEKSRKIMTTESTDSQAAGYLDWLAEQKYVNRFEETKLRAAAALLFQKYSGLDKVTKDQVQEEFTGEKTPRFTVIADKEETYWREALNGGREPLPGFDYANARAIFTAPPEERTTRVAFLKPEFATDVPMVDIRRELAKAAAFFHIILRMVRKQYEKDHPTPQSLVEGFANDLPAEVVGALHATPLQLNEVLREPSPPEPLANIFKEERAMLANSKAMADQLHQVAEESKRLRPPASTSRKRGEPTSPSPSQSERKPTIWRKLLDRFRKK